MSKIEIKRNSEGRLLIQDENLYINQKILAEALLFYTNMWIQNDSLQKFDLKKFIKRLPILGSLKRFSLKSSLNIKSEDIMMNFVYSLVDILYVCTSKKLFNNFRSKLIMILFIFYKNNNSIKIIDLYSLLFELEKILIRMPKFILFYFILELKKYKNKDHSKVNYSQNIHYYLKKKKSVKKKLYENLVVCNRPILVSICYYFMDIDDNSIDSDLEEEIEEGQIYIANVISLGLKRIQQLRTGKLMNILAHHLFQCGTLIKIGDNKYKICPEDRGKFFDKMCPFYNIKIEKRNNKYILDCSKQSFFFTSQGVKDGKYELVIRTLPKYIQNFSLFVNEMNSIKVRSEDFIINPLKILCQSIGKKNIKTLFSWKEALIDILNNEYTLNKVFKYYHDDSPKIVLNNDILYLMLLFILNPKKPINVDMYSIKINSFLKNNPNFIEYVIDNFYQIKFKSTNKGLLFRKLCEHKKSIDLIKLLLLSFQKERIELNHLISIFELINIIMVDELNKKDSIHLRQSLFEIIYIYLTELPEYEYSNECDLYEDIISDGHILRKFLNILASKPITKITNILTGLLSKKKENRERIDIAFKKKTIEYHESLSEDAKKEYYLQKIYSNCLDFDYYDLLGYILLYNTCY